MLTSVCIVLNDLSNSPFPLARKRNDALPHPSWDYLIIMPNYYTVYSSVTPNNCIFSARKNKCHNLSHSNFHHFGVCLPVCILRRPIEKKDWETLKWRGERVSTKCSQRQRQMSNSNAKTEAIFQMKCLKIQKHKAESRRNKRKVYIFLLGTFSYWYMITGYIYNRKL